MHLDAALRSHGHRVTRQRRVVWDVMSSTDGHMSANEITARVQAVDPNVNTSSIYRTLALFTEIGIVRESRLGDASTWERAHSDAVIHLVCSSCGAVHHHHAASIDQLPDEITAAGFQPDIIDVSVTGRCKDCAR